MANLPGNEVKEKLMARLKGVTSPVSKKGLITAVYGANYSESQGNSVTRALMDLRTRGLVWHPDYDQWMPAVIDNR